MWKKIPYLLKKNKINLKKSPVSILKNSNSKRKAFVFNDTRSERHFGCDCVMENLIAILEASDISPSYFYDVGKDCEQDNSVPIRMAECDVVIVNGEGSIHHSNHRAKSLSRVGSLAKSMGKPVFLLNATLFKNDAKIYESLSFFDFIYARDFYSAKEAALHGVEVSYAPDFTFYSDFSDVKEKVKSKSSQVLVGDSVIAKASNELDVFAQNNGFERIQILHKREKFPLISEHIVKMSEAELIVTGRFHTVCFCLNAGIPFIAIESNTNKISSLLDDCFDDRRRVMSVDKLGSLALSEFSSFNQSETLALKEFKARAKKCYDDVNVKLKSLL